MRKGYDEPVLIVKKTLLLLTVSFTGILKAEISDSLQIFSAITLESVYTTLLLQDDSNNKDVSIIMNGYLLIPFIIESFVFSFVLVLVLPAFIVRRIESRETVIL